MEARDLGVGEADLKGTVREVGGRGAEAAYPPDHRGRLTPAGTRAAVACVHAVMQQVRDNRSEQEFTLEVEGETAVAAYQREGDTIVFTHTLVPPRLEGHGVGSRLVRGALDLARDEGLRVIAQCPFVAAYIKRHPEYRDLLVR
jgi:predicted GNAT family acetyltransferase